jgi:hypothetical protein
MPGDVTLRGLRILRKPGTRHLLSVPSDALHLMNIRGKLLIENCSVEAPGDDCLNVGTLLERIVEVSEEDPKAITLRTTDNRYYHYTLRESDRLQFLDTKTKREIGIAAVGQVEFDPRRRSHRVVLDRELAAFDPAEVLVLNLNQMTSATVIRNNVMLPYMRNAMLVRAQHMIIHDNKLDGSHGGVIGLNFTYSMGESARLRGVSVSSNTITGFQSSALIVSNAYRDHQGVLDTRDLSITGNLFQVATAKAIQVRGVQNLGMAGNRFERDGKPVEQPAEWVETADCLELRLKHD